LQDLLDLYIDGGIDPDMVDHVEGIIEMAIDEWRAGAVGGYYDRPDDEFDLMYQWVENGCPAEHTPKWPGIKRKKQFHYDGQRVEYIPDPERVFVWKPRKPRLASFGSSPPLYDGTAQTVTCSEQLSRISDEKLLKDLAKLIESRITACLRRFSKSPNLYRLAREDLRQEACVAVLRTRHRFASVEYTTAYDRLLDSLGRDRGHAGRTVKYTTWVTTVIDHALSDYAKREVGESILGDKSTTVSEMAARRAPDREADLVAARCLLESMPTIHAQTILVATLAKDGREASEMVGVGHAAFRQRLKRALAAVGADEDARPDQKR